MIGWFFFLKLKRRFGVADNLDFACTIVGGNENAVDSVTYGTEIVVRYWFIAKGINSIILILMNSTKLHLDKFTSIVHTPSFINYRCIVMIVNDNYIFYYNLSISVSISATIVLIWIKQFKSIDSNLLSWTSNKSAWIGWYEFFLFNIQHAFLPPASTRKNVIKK